MIRIVARTNGVGIDRDVRLLSDAIARSAPRPEFSRYRSITPLHRFITPSRKDGTIVFLERITARWLRRADRFFLVPNQERYATRLVPLLAKMTGILCKTRHAEEIFSRLHPSVHYLGFTSDDRLEPDTAKDYSRFFHLAGGSALKGTEVLTELWADHPEWPELTLVQHRGKPTSVSPPNVRRIHTYLPDQDLRSLQNQCGVHLCPSTSEGWGHSIVEGMSCAALVLTTDGPPMNELVTPDRGVLVPWSNSEPRKLGTNYFVDPHRLESAIQGLIAMTVEEKERMGAAARSWFLRNHAEFCERTAALVPLLTTGSGSRIA